MKKTIRIFIKLLFLPFTIVFYMFIIPTAYAFIFVGWVYDVDEWERQLNKNTLSELKNDFKNSFRVFR